MVKNGKKRVAGKINIRYLIIYYLIVCLIELLNNKIYKRVSKFILSRVDGKNCR